MTSPWLSPSAVNFCWSMSIFSVAMSGRSLEPDRGELRIGVGLGQQLVARRGERLAAHAAAVLQLHGEAVGLAEAADGARAPARTPARRAGCETRSRPAGRSASAVFALPVRSSHGARLMKPWPVFWPVAPPPPPPPATVNRVWMFLRSWSAKYCSIWRCTSSVRCLGGAGGKAELDAGRALVLGRQEAGRKPQEQQDQDGDDAGVDRQEQPFAVDHLDHRRRGSGRRGWRRCG